MPLYFLCAPLPFTNLQYGLGPEFSPPCLSFLFYTVRGALDRYSVSKGHFGTILTDSPMI